METTIKSLLDGTEAEAGAVGLSALIAQLLEPLTFELDVKAKGVSGDDMRYELGVHHRRAHATWRHPRSFDEYLRFHGDLLRALHHGHFCRASCPWLQGFVQRRVERRRNAILQLMQTLQHFLVDKDNQACVFIRRDVAEVFLDFVFGDVVDNRHVLDKFLAPLSPAKIHSRARGFSSPADSTNRSPLDKTESTPSSHTSPPAPSKEPATTPIETCLLCSQALPTKSVYVMQLDCGHRFHDECVLPRLNDALECPTCHLGLESNA
ncbi:hypothetical protein P43SY_005388 [Pythium insidiosum]|uniref:RING-type domain-containing protein n=1 Tax=Pythium insidiosum TaxID=114742 RepID=A0AAD5LCE4_PYTIN|nr:hypothetical protein P43SY_005388 [Pythium insidiosum]